MSGRRSLDQLDRLPVTLGREVVHVGPLAGFEHYVVHGRVQGNGDIAGALLIGADGLWVGNIVADVVVVKGRVQGNIHARFKLELRAGARIAGDVSSPVIAVAEGAVLQGRVSADSVITRFIERRAN